MYVYICNYLFNKLRQFVYGYMNPIDFLRIIHHSSGCPLWVINNYFIKRKDKISIQASIIIFYDIFYLMRRCIFSLRRYTLKHLYLYIFYLHIF